MMPTSPTLGGDTEKAWSMAQKNTGLFQEQASVDFVAGFNQ